MKKNILKVALVAAVVATVGYGVYENQKQETMPDVMLANVEALANPEILIAFCMEADVQCNGVGIEDIQGYRQY